MRVFLDPPEPVYLDELEPVTLASAEVVTTSPEAAEVVPVTLGQLMQEHPDLIAQIRAEGVASVNVAAAKAEGKTEGIAEGATAERARILGILSHTEAHDRRGIACKLAAMPSMTVETAAALLAGMPKMASGPEAEFRQALAKSRPTPIDNQDEMEAFVARMRALDEQELATRARARPAQASEGR